MSGKHFTPCIAVRHTSRVPNPILPVNYGFFLMVALPVHIATLPLRTQIAMARVATTRRRAVPSPFGDITAFQCRLTSKLNIYLNPNAEFAPRNMKTKSEYLTTESQQQYIVGHRKGGASWFLPEVKGEPADDQNLEAARRFSSLAEALAVSIENSCNV